MATMTQVEERLREQGVPPFRPGPVYERHTDSLMFYIKDVPSYASRLNSRFTIFRDAENDALIGFEIKGFSRLLRHYTSFDLMVTKEAVTLKQCVGMVVDPLEHDQFQEDDGIQLFLRQWQGELANLHETPIDTDTLCLH